MKKTVIFLIGFILIFSSQAFAHGGKTDSSGGHRDSNNVSGLGHYHYHCDGHPAHSHENGICPYETSVPAYSVPSYTNNDSSDINSVVSIEQEHIVSEIPDQNDSEPTKWIEMLFFISCAVSLVSLFIGWAFSALDKRPLGNTFLNISKYSFLLVSIMFLFPIIGGMALISLVFAIPSALKKFLALILRFFDTEDIEIKENDSVNDKRNLVSVEEFDPYGNWSFDDDPVIPPGYTIGSLGLPADENAPKHWGKTFTVYVEPSEKKYHRGRCCHVTPEKTYPSHILLAKKSNLPCEICKPEMPDMTWFFNMIKNDENQLLHDLIGKKSD